MNKNYNEFRLLVEAKPSTVLTNLQRGNVKQETPMLVHQMSIHELSAQGELHNVNINVVDIGDANNLTPLFWAASYGQNSTVEYLLNLGANPNHKSAGNRTALMYAAAKGYCLVVKTLIKSGAQIDDADDSGSTALMYAAHQNQSIVIDELLRNGANLSISNVYSQTAYSICISKNNVEALTTINNYLMSILSPSLRNPLRSKTFLSPH